MTTPVALKTPAEPYHREKRVARNLTTVCYTDTFADALVSDDEEERTPVAEGPAVLRDVVIPELPGNRFPEVCGPSCESMILTYYPEWAGEDAARADTIKRHMIVPNTCTECHLPIDEEFNRCIGVLEDRQCLRTAHIGCGFKPIYMCCRPGCCTLDSPEQAQDLVHLYFKSQYYACAVNDKMPKPLREMRMRAHVAGAKSNLVYLADARPGLPPLPRAGLLPMHTRPLPKKQPVYAQPIEPRPSARRALAIAPFTDTAATASAQSIFASLGRTTPTNVTPTKGTSCHDSPFEVHVTPAALSLPPATPASDLSVELAAIANQANASAEESDEVL